MVKRIKLVDLEEEIRKQARVILRAIKESADSRAAFIMFNTNKDFTNTLKIQFITVSGYVCKLRVVRKTKVLTLELSLIELGNQLNYTKLEYIFEKVKVKYLNIDISKYKEYFNMEIKIREVNIIKIKIEISIINVKLNI